ncbi:MAG: N-acetyltransferase family protein [Dongiaceae bacterium]
MNFTPALVIRPIRNEKRDLEALARMAHELAAHDGYDSGANTEKLAKGLFDSNKTVHCHLAELKGEIAGFILFYENFSIYRGEGGVFVPGLYVMPEYRKQGLGKKLMGIAAQYVKDHNRSYISWFAEEKNETALPLYKKWGARMEPGWIYCLLSGEALEKMLPK